METVALLFGVQPLRIGGVEFFTRELAGQLAVHGWRLVAIFGGPPPPQVAAFLDSSNLAIEVVPSLEFSNLHSIPPVWNILRKYRPRVFHFHFLNFIGPYPWLAKLQSVERVYFTAHGSNPSGYVAHRAAAWKRLVAGLINFPLQRTFCVSEYVHQTMVTQNLLPAERFLRIYNGIPIPGLPADGDAAASFRARFGIPQEKKLIVQVSWIIPEKGIDDLLAAAKLVLERNPNTHFAFVGNGNPLPQYRTMAQEMGIGSSVTFTGLMDNPMAEGAYTAADLFCLASRWEEAFGWVLAEAMSFQKPVVATHVGAIPEVVQNGVTGILVPPQNPRELAAAILKVLDHPDRQRMGEAARQRVEELFDLRSMVRQLIHEYGVR